MIIHSMADKIEEVSAFGRKTILDGIIAGVPVGDSASRIVQHAFLFGIDEARRREYFPISVSAVSMEELKRDAVLAVIDGLFGNSGMNRVIDQIVNMGVAFGFAEGKKRLATDTLLQEGRD